MVWSGFGAILPYLPVFLNEQAHAPMWMIGLIASMYYAGTFTCSSPLGRLSDRIGRKPVMVSGMFIYALSTFLFVTTTERLVVPAVQAARGRGRRLGRAGRAAPSSPTSATRSMRGRAYGLLTSAQFGGLVAGPALAILLNTLGGGGKHGFYTIFLAGSAMTLAMGVLLAVALKESPHVAARRKEKVPRPSYRSLATPPVVAFLVIAATAHYAMGGWEVLWSLWLRHLGASMAYVSATWIAFSIPMLFSFAGGMLAERGNRFRLMFAGYAFSAFSWIVYGFTRNLTVFLLFNLLEGVAVAVSMPAKQAFLVQCSPRRWLGAVQGMEQTSMQLAAFVGTFTAPLLFTWISGYAIGVGGFLALVGLAVHGADPGAASGRGSGPSGEALSLAEAERLAAAPASAAFDDERMRR